MKIIYVLSMLLVGCTASTEAMKADAEATKAGCLCAGVRCGVLISGSGQAAVGAEASGALRSMVVDGSKAK